MTRKEFIKLYTNEKTGKLELPYGIVLGSPWENKPNDIGVYQNDDGYWITYKVGIPMPFGSGDAQIPCYLYYGHNVDKAFDTLYKFATYQEDADSWIMKDKCLHDDD